jgi:hypothetical protein
MHLRAPRICQLLGWWLEKKAEGKMVWLDPFAKLTRTKNKVVRPFFAMRERQGDCLHGPDGKHCMVEAHESYQVDVNAQVH